MDINNAAQLKEAIALLEKNIDFKKKILTDQYRDTYESLKPVNLIKNSVRKFAAKPGIVNKLAGLALGTGRMTAKKLPAKRPGLFKRAVLFTLNKVIGKKA